MNFCRTRTGRKTGGQFQSPLSQYSRYKAEYDLRQSYGSKLEPCHMLARLESIFFLKSVLDNHIAEISYLSQNVSIFENFNLDLEPPDKAKPRRRPVLKYFHRFLKNKNV